MTEDTIFGNVAAKNTGSLFKGMGRKEERVTRKGQYAKKHHTSTNTIPLDLIFLTLEYQCWRQDLSFHGNGDRMEFCFLFCSLPMSSVSSLSSGPGTGSISSVAIS